MADEKRKKDQTAAGMRGQPFVRVRMAPSPDAAARQAAQPSSSNQGFGESVVRAAAPLVNNFVEGLKVLPTLATQEGRIKVRSGWDTLTGQPYGGEKVPVQPVEDALAQGREAMNDPEAIVPADRQSQLIASILGSGLTIKEAATMAGILPQTTGKSAPNTKAVVMSQAAALSRELYEDQVAKARALEATDPDGAKAAVESAAKNYFNQTAGLVGFNPVQLAQAQLMDQGGQ